MHVAYYLTGNISEKPFILAGRSDHSGVYPLFFLFDGDLGSVFVFWLSIIHTLYLYINTHMGRLVPKYGCFLDE